VRPRRAVPPLVAVLIPILLALLLLALVPAAFAAAPAEAPKDVPAAVKSVPAAPPDRAAELAGREKALKEEEERLVSLRKEVDGKIAKYEKLLAELETRDKRGREEDEAKTDTLVKLFEGMTPEAAAPRLEALDDGMAASILSKMKGRKASNVLAVMEPKKAAVLVRKMAGGVKNFPAP